MYSQAKVELKNDPIVINRGSRYINRLICEVKDCLGLDICYELVLGTDCGRLKENEVWSAFMA